MTDSIRELLKSRPVWIALALVAVLVTLPWVVSAYILGILTIAFYFGVFAMCLGAGW